MLKHVALWGVHLDWERASFLEGLEDLELAYHSKVRRINIPLRLRFDSTNIPSRT